MSLSPHSRESLRQQNNSQSNIKSRYDLSLTGRLILLTLIFRFSASQSATRSSFFFSPLWQILHFLKCPSVSPRSRALSFTELFLWTYGAVFFFSSTQKFAGSRWESEYCRVFNPLYLWGLSSIWYQICISQMGFDCFPVAVTHASTRVQIHPHTQIYIHMHWLRLGSAVLMLLFIVKVGIKGVFFLIVAPCRVSST